MKNVIEVENLSKGYQLGVFGFSRFRDDIKKYFFGREEENEFFWALNEINFSVKEGEVLGVIGHNGAGKSTLLKVLSRITYPTIGEIRIKGRIASLLEVGTGFHPELTGRENVYLNGAILGMTKNDVRKHFDEIIAFSGIEDHIDTPVKRYSSGMKVRLGFAVAAHLQPEILIIDEVLAVGDAAFQKKCIGKMKDVSSTGRTILFVSHNMTAVSSLCERSIQLDHGKLVFEGRTPDVINNYFGGSGIKNYFSENQSTFENGIKINEAFILKNGGDKHDVIGMEDSIEFKIDIDVTESNERIDCSIQVLGTEGQVLFVTGSGNNVIDVPRKSNRVYKVLLPGNFFNSGNFEVNLMIVKNRSEIILRKDSFLGFTVIDRKKDQGQWLGRTKGDLYPLLKWSID